MSARPENQFSRLVNKIATPADKPVWGSPEWHEEMRAGCRRAMTTTIITIEELCGLPPNGEIGDSGGPRHSAPKPIELEPLPDDPWNMEGSHRGRTGE